MNILATKNEVILVGRVGRNPEVHETKKGEKVAYFSLATNRFPNEAGEDRTDWHRVVARRGHAQWADDRVSVGDILRVTGRIEYDSYERDGITIPSTEIVVTGMQHITRHDLTVYEKRAVVVSVYADGRANALEQVERQAEGNGSSSFFDENDDWHVEEWTVT